MSKHVSNKRVSLRDITARKGGEKIVVLTAYSEPFARLFDSHVDILLVGDSLGMVLYGMESTLNLPLEVMVRHTRAVVDASSHAMVVLDMPFGSYQESPQQAFRNAARAMAESGAQAVKLEGGEEMAETVHFLIQRGIPVMGHVGLKPQHFNAEGGFRYQGRSKAEHKQILRDAKAIAEAGAFSMVMEGVKEDVAADIAPQIAVPIIGIGASAACDGQVLVAEDMLGLTARAPKFVKHYAQLGKDIEKAVQLYAKEVRSGKFPAPEHTYGVK